MKLKAPSVRDEFKNSLSNLYNKIYPRSLRSLVIIYVNVQASSFIIILHRLICDLPTNYLDWAVVELGVTK